MACNACAGAKQKCGGGEVERLERPEKKRVKAAWTKQSTESEEERLEMWVPQAPRAEVEFMNVVRATHNLVMRRVAELEEWRKEARAEQEAVAEDQRILQEILTSLGEKVAVEKAVAEVAEKKAEVGVVAGKVAEAEGMDIAEVGVEAEEGEVVTESRPKKPKDILQASPGTPPST